MAKTYVPLATQTLGSAAASVTFSSISGAYTDLVLVMTSDKFMTVRLNSDSGSNYSQTFVVGNGTTASSGRETSQTKIYTPDALGALTWASSIMNFMNYANATTYKTILTRDGGSSGTVAEVALWRSTAAITAIEISAASAMAIGSVFTLYGIAAA